MEILNHDIQLFCMADNWSAIQVDDINDVEKDYDNSFILNVAEEIGQPVVLSCLLHVFNTTHTIPSLWKNNEYLEGNFFPQRKVQKNHIPHASPEYQH